MGSELLVPTHRKEIEWFWHLSHLIVHKRTKNAWQCQEGQEANTKHKLILLWNDGEAPSATSCSVIASEMKDIMEMEKLRKLKWNGQDDEFLHKKRNIKVFRVKMNMERVMIKMYTAFLRQLPTLKVSGRKWINMSDSSHGVNANNFSDFDLRALSMLIYLVLKIAWTWYDYFP